ncbi:MAG: transposase [Natronospirillum sp.]
MARLPRLNLPGCPQHVIQRGAVHAFVLMTNHVHLLVTPASERGVSQMMQAQGRKYVQYFNFTYGRTGTLWEGRYKSTLVDADNYLLTVYRYIELNPVRAGMVSHASEYPWSSYRGNALGKPVQLLKPHELYQQLGRTQSDRQTAYRELFRGRMPERDLAAIREATNKAWVLGDDRFKSQIEAKLGRRPAPLGRGGDRKSRAFREARNQ